MEGPPARFRGFPYPQGLLVLDEVTGEVVLVPADGSPTRQVRPAGSASPLVVTQVTPVTPASPVSIAAPMSAPVSAPVSAPTSIVPIEMTDLDREVIATFPYPVAVVYARLFSEPDPRQRCRLLVDTFATLLKLWALALASDYLARGELQDATLNDLLARDFQRPLISVWHVFATRALAFFKANRMTPFLSELAAAYDTLETKCRTPFIATARFEDGKGEARVRESKLGKIQALIKYRNGLAHGYNLPAARAEQHCTTYLPVLREILSEARFMARYPLYGAAGSRVFRLMGATPEPRPETLGAGVEVDLRSTPVFIVDAQKRVLPLEALAVVEAPEHADNALPGLDRDVFFFEGNTRTAIIYASPLGEHLEKQHHVDRWRALLEAKAVDVKVLRKDKIDLPALRSAAERVTNGTLQALVASGKFVPEVTYRPPAVADRLGQFELGDHRAIVFVGDSGSGKSTLAASIASERVAAKDVVLFYRASSLLDADLQSRIARDLGLRDLFFEDFLGVADAVFDAEPNARFRVIVDGVNEHPGDVAALVSSIDAMVRQAADHPWFRLVATVRTAAYERLPQDARFGRLEGTRYVLTEMRHGTDVELAPVVPVPPLSDAEVGEVYERYRAFRKVSADGAPESRALSFRPTTSFAELVAGGRGTVAMMRSPLMMRLIVAAFDGRPLDPELGHDEAMRLYFEHVVVGTHDKGGARWERGAFLKALVAELDAVSSDIIERDALYQIQTLKRAVQNTQKDSAYVQLLDLGVLTEQWDRDRCLVRFGFDRLFEYLLAEVHESACRDPYGVLDLARRAGSFAGLGAALVVALSAQCRKGDATIFARALAMADGMPKTAPERRMMLLVGRAVVERLAHEGEPLAAALAALRAHPVELAVAVLLDAFDGLFMHGETAAAESLLEAARAMAESLGHAASVARALYGAAMLHQRRSELDGAIKAFERVTELANASGDVVSAQRAAVKQSEILRNRGELDAARALLETATTVLRDSGATADAAEAQRQQAIVAMTQARFNDARVLVDGALVLAHESGDANVESQCFISSGVLAWRRGDLANATDAYEHALRIAEQQGHARNMAIVSANLGILAHERCEFADAVRHTKKQLDMSRRIQDKRLVASALQNLGVFHFEAGDLESASRALDASRTTWTDAGDLGTVATALVNQAAVDIHRGQPNAAVALLATALDLASEHGNDDAKLDCLWLRASLALDADDIEAARAWTERLRTSKPAQGAPRRDAQVAALEIRAALRTNERETARAWWPIIEKAFVNASPLPEVHELPIDAALELAKERIVPAAAKTALGWLRGRPHRHARALAELTGAQTAAAG